MSLFGISICFLAFLAIGYRIYGRFIASKFQIDDSVKTPAVSQEDGVDYCPTPPFYLFGQHFSAIAAAGPIAGPILASQQFGWLPCLLWIAVGAVFIGAVHDFASLIASVRHNARSIAEIMKSRLGERAWLCMMLFIWVALIYVILAFTDITAGTFVGVSEDLEGASFKFNPGGAVAFAGIMYLALAVVMGFVERYLKPPLWLLTIVFVPASLFVVWLGTQYSTLFVLGAGTWSLIILAYCFIASLLPVHVLLQPRGYLGGFILYIALAIGVLGVFFGKFAIQQQPFTTFHAGGLTGDLFPFLFVTIACGACSGFHGLVASGTTSKQIRVESHCKPVGYGAMLLEGFVALIALATVMIALPASIKGVAPGIVYGQGIGQFLSVLIGKEHLLFAVTFGSMAFSTFIFDTLDVATRLGRYIMQELFGLQGRRGAVIGTFLTIAPPAFLLMLAGSGAYRNFWVLFGTSNQLLAALTLLGLSVWLKQTGRSYLFAFIPMVFVMTITVWSLVLQALNAYKAIAINGLQMNVTFLNGIVSLLLLSLATMMTVEALRRFSAPKLQPQT